MEKKIKKLIEHSEKIVKNNGWEKDAENENYNIDSLEFEMGYQRALKNLLFMMI